MSVNTDEESGIDQRDLEAVWTLAFEPSYVSEIARKMQLIYDDWADLEENTAVRLAGSIAFALSQNMNIEDEELGGEDGLYMPSSPKYSFDGNGFSETDRWRDYKFIYNQTSNFDEAREEAMEYVDTDITLPQKMDMVKSVSLIGNDVSRNAEEIMQDVMERQFRHYDVTEKPDYNDPGVDFYVEDEGRREWGLCVEVSVRYVNPIDKPYVDSKKEKAIDKDSDLVILAPRFTDDMLEKYEDESDPAWHSNPEGEIVHLHHLPPKDFEVYNPFNENNDLVEGENNDRGNPIIVPDSENLRGTIDSSGLLGDSYPVVESEYGEFANNLSSLHRSFVVVRESRYRHYIREAIEPLLWEFLRPYKVEQFLVDTYWDKGLTQSDIGKLVDRSGGTIGTWMQKHGIMRRGTGAPELSAEVIEIWKRMYNGESPFPEQFSGYRIQAEYNRHPLWDLSDWRDWYNSTTEEQRQKIMASRGSYRDNLDYTIISGATDRLLPSYSFILSTLKEEGVDVRPPDEAPRVPYSAYPNKGALEYMINKDQNTIVEVSDE